MADRSLCGREYPPFTWEVERGKIRELVQAIGDGNPVYVDKQAAKDAGYQDTPAPPTYITLPTLWRDVIGTIVRDVKANPLRSLHGEQNYEYFQEIYPGDVLTGRVKIMAVERKSGKVGELDVVRIGIMYTNQRNEPVLRVTSMLVEML